ncbi:MAG TPA: MFS transporter, partial [Clostridiales bacterium]|nr:MFS transporter [Clostridiales bacterium]
GLLIDNLNIGYRVLFPYAAFFSALALITMLFVKHGDSKPIPKNSLLESISGED